VLAIWADGILSALQPPVKDFTDQNTDAFCSASAHQTVILLLCVFDAGRLLSCHWFVGVTKSFVFTGEG